MGIRLAQELRLHVEAWAAMQAGLGRIAGSVVSNTTSHVLARRTIAAMHMLMTISVEKATWDPLILGVFFVVQKLHQCVLQNTSLVITTRLAAVEALVATQVVRARIAGSVASAVFQSALHWGEGCMSSCDGGEHCDT